MKWISFNFIYVVLLLVCGTECPEGESNFTVQPMSVIQAEGLEAVFECLYPGATFSWFLNGRILLDSSLGIDTDLPSRGSPASLTIPARPEFNNTVVQCEAVVRVGGGAKLVLSDNATLVVYGVNINNVNNARDTITLSWERYHFTTDITYCVDVIQPFGMPLLVSSECGLTDSVYTFTSPGHGPCDRFNFTVTPTDGVTNGTSSEPVTGYFTPARGLVNKVIVTALQGHPEEKSILIHSNATVCNDSVSLQVDSNGVTVTNRSVSNASEISFSLPTDRRTNVTITLTNKDGVELLFQNITISTFEVQTLTAKLGSQPNSINVSLTYAVGSSALGALIVLVSMKSNGSLDLDYRMLRRSRSDDYVILHNVSSGNYILQYYDIKNYTLIGEPETTVAASMDIYNITGDSISPRHPMENEYVTVDETSAGIWTVSCDVTMFENCLVIVHSTDIKKPLKIAHLHSGNPTVDLTVEGTGDFNVVVFSGTEILLSSKITMTAKSTTESSTEPTQMIQTSDTSSILFGIAGVLVLIVIIVVVVIVVWRKKFTSKKVHFRASSESQVHRDDSPPGYETVVEFRNTSNLSSLVTVQDVEINRDPASLLYENTPLLTVSGPHYETVQLPDDAPPPLPPPRKSEDGQVQNGSSSMATTEEPHDITQPKSHDSHMEGYVVPEPAYDVAKRVMAKDSTNSGPLLDSTTTEHQYSEIRGSNNKEGTHYAHVNPKPKPEGLPVQPVDTTDVVYSEVSKSKESENPPQTKTAPPIPPPPPTAESLLSIIHSIACKWEEFGEALEIDEDRLDGFSNQAHDQVRLHNMIRYYFSNVHNKCTWEEFVQALRKIGEYECADKIVREMRLEDDQLDPEPVSSPLVPPCGLSTPQAAESVLEPQTIEVGPVTYMLGTLKPEALPDQPVIPTTGVNSKENLTSESEDGEQQSQSSSQKRTTSILKFSYKRMNKETPKPGNQLVPVDHLGEQNNVSRDEETALQSNRTNNETEKFSGQPAQEDKPSLNNRTEIPECVITAYDNLAK